MMYFPSFPHRKKKKKKKEKKKKKDEEWSWMVEVDACVTPETRSKMTVHT